MKKWCIIFTILFLCSVVYASEYKLVFDDNLKDGEVFKADEKTFQIFVINNETIKFDFPNGKSKIIYLEECESEDVYYVCFTDISKGGDEDFNITTQTYPLKPKIKIEKQNIDIKLNREFEKIKALKGESIKVGVLIENNGAFPILDAMYTDEFPSEINIVSTENCERDGNKVIWKGTLTLIGDRKFSYIIKGNQGTEFKSNAILLYGSENKTDSEDIVIDGNSPLKVSVNINSTEVLLGEDVLVNITLMNNNSNYNVTDLIYKIYVPDGLEKLWKLGDINNIGNYFLFDKSLGYDKVKGRGDEESIVFIFNTQKIGNLQIISTADYMSGGVKIKDSYAYDVNVTMGELNITIYKEVNYTIGGKAIIPVIIENPERNKLFKNINLKVVSDLNIQKEKARIDEIEPGVREVIDLPVRFPNETGNYTLNISLDYQTIYGEEILHKEEAIISVVYPILTGEEIEEWYEDKKEDDGQSSTRVGKEYVKVDYFILKLIGIIALAFAVASLIIWGLIKIRKEIQTIKNLKRYEEDYNKKWEEYDKKCQEKR